MHDLKNKIKGGIWGLLIGDALGVPYEFHLPENIPKKSDINFVSPLGFKRSHSKVPSGTWSDDGAHALCLLASLLECNCLDPSNLMRKIFDWYENGYMAVDGNVFDVGIQTTRALQNYRAGIPALDCGPNQVHDNGNGALMRSLPLALWHKGSDYELIQDAHLQSKITHGHLRSQICCALYCLWARRILENHIKPWDSSVKTVRRFYGEGSIEQAELEYYIRPDDALEGKGSSYVVDCLRSAKMVYDNNQYYEDVVKEAIMLGFDTDTTSCVAGGISGLKQGLSEIPEKWQTELRGVEIFMPLLDELLTRFD